MQDFRNLNVWKNSHTWTLGIYKATKTFPKHELFGLTSQIQRAAVSIPANIAEGCGKATDADFARYVQIAMGSSSELEYLLLLAHDLEYIPDEIYSNLHASLVQVRKMLNALLQTLRQKR
jgi:four helix bundle protein